MSKLELRALPHWKKWPRLLWSKAQELHGLSDFSQRNSPYAPEAFRAVHSYHSRPDFQGRVAWNFHVRSRGDLMYLLILRRSQSSPFSLLYITLWKPTGLPRASQIVCFLHGLCKFCHHLCPEEHYELGGCLKTGAGFVSSSMYCLRWFYMLKRAFVGELDLHRPCSFMGFLRLCMSEWSQKTQNLGSNHHSMDGKYILDLK